MSTPVLQTRGLAAGYGNGMVVRDLDLDIASGEIVALLGPNGAGKTTVLRAVAGLLRETTVGAVRLFDEPATDSTVQRRARRGLGYVMEGHSVFAQLTVDEHFKLRARDAAVDQQLAYDYFPALVPLRRRRAGLLSGGEQQMLAIASALSRRPRLLLVDELSQGLAPVIVERIVPVLRRYADETGAGVLLVEQRVHLALEVADRGCLLTHGSLTLDRPAGQLRANPQLIAAGYLGSAADPAPPGQVP